MADKPWRWAVLWVGLFGAVAGCGGGAKQQACAPGRWEACVGPGGCAGGQECNADGTGFAPCVCGGQDAGVQLDAALDAPAPDDGPPPADGPDDGAPAADGPDDGAPVDGPTAIDVTVGLVQNSGVAVGTCVRVQVVAMSGVFDDHDNTFTSADGGVAARKAFYVSDQGLSTTAPRTGIEVVVNPDVPTPTVAPGDDLTIVATYHENFENSTLRLTAACGSVTHNGTATMPAPAALTIAALGQTGGSTGCPPSGAPWVDGASAEDYEGVLVTITTGTVSQPRDGFGVFEVTDGTAKLQVDARAFGLAAAPNAADSVQAISGFGFYSFCRRKLRPRSDAEVATAYVANCGAGVKADHLLLTEVKLGPTAGELVEIHNPTGAAVDLSSYYLYNASFAGTPVDGGVTGACRYYDIVAGAECGTTSGDFSLQFPSGASIAPGEYQVIAITGAANYCATYYPSVTCVKPAYEIPPPTGGDPTVPDMRHNWDATATNFTSFGFLSSVGEDLVLFYWNGSSPTVKDVDYLVWGTGVRTSKTGVSTYAADTPIASQQAAPGSPSNSQSLQRVCMNEGAETKAGGNGITGHDETSEALGITWVVRDPTPGAATVGATP